jgi:GT2 family glycosyltransferase
MPQLTVVICTHNRAGLLEKTLASLNGARRPEGWEVTLLVGANACKDGTHAFLEEYQRQSAHEGWLPLSWFAEATPGKSHALNRALPQVGGELAAFVDDDHRVDSEYLAAVCAAAAAHPDADLFCGRILPDWDGTEPAWVHDTGPYRIYPLPVPRFDIGSESREVTPDVAIPGGGNLFVRVPWLSRVGPFATELGPTGHDLGGSEDLDWILRALGLGARLRYVPGMVQYHYVDGARLTLGYLLKKAYRRTASTVHLEQAPGRAGVPRYLYRKLGAYAIKALTALRQARRRFYLVRTAAALGEIAGYLALRRRLPHTDSTARS